MRCLAGACRGRPAALCGWLAAGLIALAGGAPAARGATAEELADATTKAEYAFFTEDQRALETLLDSLAAFGGSGDPGELYAYAYAEFRRLQLAARAHDAHKAEAAGSGCLAALERRRASTPRDPEGLALEAACAGYLAELGGLRRLTAAHRRDASLAAARALAPANPRVLLSGALATWFQNDAPATARSDARRAFVQLASTFDAISVPAAGEPTWGGAEAWLFAGRGLEEEGDLVGARSAYERALLIAPDFASARRHLQSLAGTR